MEKGTITVCYGSGGGKSSSALGQAVRMASTGKTAYIIQFLKGPLQSEYASRLEPELKLFRFERSEGTFEELSDEQKEEEKKNIKNGLGYAKKVLGTGECDLLVLDEILGAVNAGVVSKEEVWDVLSVKPEHTFVIMTGTRLPEGFAERADCVLNIISEKGGKCTDE